MFRDLFYTLMLYVLKQTLILLHKGHEMVISSPDIPLQEEIRYFPSKAYGGNTRKVFADHFVRILLHTQQKQLSESDLPE